MACSVRSPAENEHLVTYYCGRVKVPINGRLALAFKQSPFPGDEVQLVDIGSERLNGILVAAENEHGVAKNTRAVSIPSGGDGAKSRWAVPLVWGGVEAVEHIAGLCVIAAPEQVDLAVVGRHGMA